MILLKAKIDDRLARLQARRDPHGIEPQRRWPRVGDRIEFESDRQTDKGPASARIAEKKITVDGLYVSVDFGGSRQMFSWDDLGARRAGDLWMVKSIPIARARRAGDPTDAQLRSGNYKKRRITFAGLPIAIETEAGACRHGVNRDGHAWEKRLPYAYGYFEGTLGVDGDAVDCFLGPDEAAAVAYVVRQRKVNRWDQYDEDKVMLGFASESEAARCFLLGYNDDRFLGEVVPIAMDALPDRLKACRGKPLTAGGPAILLWHTR